MKKEVDEFFYRETKTNVQMCEIVALRRANRSLLERNRSLQRALSRSLTEIVYRCGDDIEVKELISEIKEMIKVDNNERI